MCWGLLILCGKCQLYPPPPPPNMWAGTDTFAEATYYCKNTCRWSNEGKWLRGAWGGGGSTLDETWDLFFSAHHMSINCTFCI